jgi:tellurite resistance protein TerC
MTTVGEWWMWLGFAVFVVLATAIDLLVIRQQGAHRVSIKEAVLWSLVWISLALVFCLVLWAYLRSHVGAAVADAKALEFLTGYLIEKSLAVDNIFVFLLIFNFFAVPPEFQKRALVIGVIGAILLRTVMILIGAWLIAMFHWILYLFGAFLVFSGIKMWWAAGQQPDLENNPVLRFARRHMRISLHFDGERLHTMVDGVRHATPLLLVLVMIAVTDVVFAVDSIPAIFAITTDPFIVLTSNIFAVLGLRAMYFVLADLADRFHYLSYGLSVVLVFIGIKMLIMDLYKIPVGVSLLVTAAILVLAISLSLLRPPRAA